MAKKKKVTKKAAKKAHRASPKTHQTSSKKELTQRQKEFLAAVRATFSGPGDVKNIREACRRARVSPYLHYITWMSQQHYAEAWERLEDEYHALIRADTLAEMERRGLRGYEVEIVEEEREAIVSQITGETELVPKKIKRKKTRKYSDSLLSHRANLLFGDSRKVEVTGKDGGPVQSEMTLRFGAVLEEIEKAKNGDGT